MALQFNKIVEAGGQILANYDFIDFIDGTGIINLWGGKTFDHSGGAIYRLSRAEFFSDQTHSGANVVGVGGAMDGQAYTKTQDINFDLTFNQPAIIKGNAIVSIPLGVRSSASSEAETFAAVSFSKISDSVETEMYGLTSGSRLYTVEAFTTKKDTIKALLPKTNFKSNDILRMKIQQYARANGTDTTKAYIGYDPFNRITSGATGIERWEEGDTRLQLQLPFKIDI